MPILQDFALSYEAGTLTVSMQPPVPIGGWSILFQMTKKFGGTPLITKSCTSGFNGVSGITITNSGAGVFQVSLTSQEVSGLDYNAYAYTVKRTDLGSETNISEGYRLLGP